jgi:hypothetical protein
MPVSGVTTDSPLTGVGIDNRRWLCEADIVDANSVVREVAEEEGPKLEVLEVPS